MLTDADRDDAFRRMQKGAPQLAQPTPEPVTEKVDGSEPKRSGDIKNIIGAMCEGSVFVAPKPKEPEFSDDQRKIIAEKASKGLERMFGKQ